jgi:hypothetical protein
MVSSQVFPEWLSPLVQAVGNAKDRPVVVLCRTGNQVRSLRRILVAGGGLMGLQIVTPSAFALSHTPTRLPAVPAGGTEEEVRPDCQLLNQIGERAQFLEHSREWARCVRLHLQAGGAAAGLTAELVEMAETGWGKTEEEEAVSSLLRRLSQTTGPVEATQLAEVGSVFCYGYFQAHGPDDFADWERAFLTHWLPGAEQAHLPFVPVPLWERRMLAALGATSLLPTSPMRMWTTESLVPGVIVPDVVAEARLAVALLREQGSSVAPALVLVPDGVSAARLRDAGLRNQLPIAETEAVPLARHPLARVVRLAANWFSGEQDPLVRASHLQRVLGDRIVGQAFPAQIGKSLDERLAALYADSKEDVPDRLLRLSGRQLTSAVVNARIVEAPLSQWIEQFASQSNTPAPPGSAHDEAHRYHRNDVRAATLLLERLRLLQASILATPIASTNIEQGEVLESAEPGYVGSELDGDGEPEDYVETVHAEQPLAGTFGALRRFLTLCTLHVRDDPAAKAVLSALGEHRSDTVTGPAVETVLAGNSQTGVLAEGVEVMQYEEYDGRPSSLLLLLGVHDKGIGRTPAPDPLAGDRVLAQVGRFGGRERVKFRMLQAVRAVTAATEVVALVSQRDETGRAVVPPVELGIDLKSGSLLLPTGVPVSEMGRDSFGLGTNGLPETANRNVLSRKESAVEDGEMPLPIDASNGRESWLAIQASVEWYRSGRGTGMPLLANGAVDDVAVAPLSELLEKTGQFAPEWAGQYMGKVPAPETGRLDSSRSWSVSSYFTPLTHCLYQLFALRVLGLREPDEISDSLLPREVGNAVHETLEKLGGTIRWQVADDTMGEEARANAVEQLRKGTMEEFATQLQMMGHVPPVTTAAAEGTRLRWDNRWPDYVQSRIRTAEQMEKKSSGKASEVISDLPEFKKAFELLDNHYSDWEPKDRVNRLRLWLAWAFWATSQNVDVTKITDDKEMLSGQGSISKKIAGTKHLKGRMLEFVAMPEFSQCLIDAAGSLAEIRAAAVAIGGNYVKSWAEQPFGRRRAGDTTLPVAEIGVSFKGTPLATHGVIDSLRRMAATGKTALQIVDYKAGKARSQGDLAKGLQSMRLPQLAVYALALQGLLDKNQAPVDAPAGSVVGSIAYDYLQGDAGSGLSEFLISQGLLAEYQTVIADLLGRAEKGEWTLAPHPGECPVLNGAHGGDYCPFETGCRFEAYPESPSLAEESNKEEGA